MTPTKRRFPETPYNFLSERISLLENCRVRVHGIAALKLPFSFFLALRYLKPKRTFISIITLISVIGVMLGITVLIVVISVMTGFDKELQRKVLGFEPHIVVTSGGLLDDWRAIKDKIDKTPGVIASAPFVQGPVIADHEGKILTPVIRGIDPEQEQKIVDLKKLMKMGKPDLTNDNVLIGARLASALGAQVGNKIIIDDSMRQLLPILPLGSQPLKNP